MSEGRYKESDIGLPPLFRLHGFGGSLSDYVEALYGQYRAMVYAPGTQLWGKPLSTWGERAADGRDEAFWHLITSSSGIRGRSRQLDLMRCARLGWVAAMLEMLAAGDMRVCCWPARHGHCEVIHVASVDFRHFIQMNERPRSIMLQTAYPIGHRHRERFIRRAAAACEAAGPAEWRRDAAACVT